MTVNREISYNTAKEVAVQLVPLPESLLTLPGRNSTAKVDLVFMAVDIPPLGYLQFHVQKSSSSRLLAQQMSRIYIPKSSKKIHWLTQKNGVSFVGMNEWVDVSVTCLNEYSVSHSCTVFWNTSFFTTHVTLFKQSSLHGESKTLPVTYCFVFTAT